MDVLTSDDWGSSWQAEARAELLRLRGSCRGWGYRPGTRAGVEPTALACLGWLASRDASTAGAGVVAAAADWLASIQGKDGSLGLAEGQPSPGWPTPYALLLWGVLGGREEPRRRAAAWLLRQKGRTIPREADSDRIVGHDTTLVGWPWVSDTHSWLEPTAMAMLALKREGFAGQGRVQEGRALICDRAIPTGGWNYGNKAAFGHALRPQPAPTGLALLALAGLQPRTEVVERAIRYLGEALGETRAPASLGWGLLGLRAWGHEPPEAGAWLAEAFRRTAGKAEAAPRLAILLLAAGRHALEVLVDGQHRDDRVG